MKSNTVKNLLLVPFFVLLWGPILQDNLHIFKGGELKGSYTLPSDISFDFKNWFDGTYSEKKGEFLSYCFGIRPDFVRIYNQLKFWTFKTSVNEKIIVGKDNYLYEHTYLDEYFGKSYIGEEKINNNIRDLKELQDTLAAHGILLYTVFAPGKGSFYPEFIPESSYEPMKPHTNYASYISACKKSEINFLDFRAWFLAMKDTSRYRLYPRCGVHWSLYGDYLAFDSIVHYVEKKTGKNLPDLILDSIELSVKPRNRDYDAGDGLNLITQFYDDTLAYPIYHADRNINDQMASLTIGDSYYFVMYGYTAPVIFKEVDFWYYFNEWWSYYGRKSSKENLKEEISRHQVVCLMFTDGSLSGFPFGFSESALKAFKNN
ncbi:MAG: hypothetical protein NTY88_09955 [Bacteroidetes bacterium]|nr:hypothetical protein [Bacteroidota bacterium]